jgi:Raf kinase inhibitor-like YbhB/YbcL family protein
MELAGATGTVDRMPSARTTTATSPLKPDRRRVLGMGAVAVAAGLTATTGTALSDRAFADDGRGHAGIPSHGSRNPYADLPRVPTFSLTSTDVATNKTLPTAQLSGLFGAGGQDLSPELRWHGAPAGTMSYALTLYDPDAATASGFWHWCVVDLPVTTTELPAGAGDPGSPLMPSGATTIPNDARLTRFVGAAPPPGSGLHHYWFVVHAVDVPSLGIDPSLTPAFVGSQLFTHTLGRGYLVPVFER